MTREIQKHAPSSERKVAIVCCSFSISSTELSAGTASEPLVSRMVATVLRREVRRELSLSKAMSTGPNGKRSVIPKGVGYIL